MSEAESKKGFIETLEASTGKAFIEWVTAIEASNKIKLHEIIKYLQDNHFFEYRAAHTLTHLYLKHKESNSPSVYFTSEGRGGKVIYKSPEASFELDWEFGGGDSAGIIYIPTPEQWEAQTKTALSERSKIVAFIGEQAVKNQTLGNGSYIVYDNSISILAGRVRIAHPAIW